MSECVEVGGVRVTQDVLDRACSWLASHGYRFASADSSPSMERFRHPDNTASSPEEFAYMLFAHPEIAPKGFRATFIDPPRPTEPASPIATLRVAGFPMIVAMRAPRAIVRRRRQVEAWASAQGGDLAPWLWVMGGSAEDRTAILARAATMFHDAMRHGVVPGGEISYRTASDLCEEVNSSDMYGPNSKHNAMGPYKTCSLLLIDGMGHERHGARELDTIKQVVGARWRDLRPTAFASPQGLSAWASNYRQVDRDAAHEVAGQITEGLSGYAQSLGTDAAPDVATRHVIDLDAPAGGGRP